MFDVLLNELAKRLNLGDRAGGLLGMLLSVIFDEKRGGFAGFIDRFRGAGLNDAVTSWLGNGENRSLSPSQLESTLGGALLSQMSSRLDISQSTVTSALGQLIPVVIDKLSPDGRLPQGLAIPDAVKPYLAGFGDFAQSAVLPEVVAKAAAQHTLDHGSATSAAGSSKWWLALIPVLIAPIFFMQRCSHDPGNPPKTMTVPPNEISAPASSSPNASAPAASAPATDAPVSSGAASSAAGTFEANAAGAAPVSADVALDQLAQQTTIDDRALIEALNLMSVRFDSGTANIKAESLAIIEKAAGVMTKLNPATRIAIHGHTDNRGDAADNMKLSEQRANAVMAKLVALGVKSTQLSAAGFGDTKPVADNSTKEGRAQNRRIEYSLGN